ASRCNDLVSESTRVYPCRTINAQPACKGKGCRMIDEPGASRHVFLPLHVLRFSMPSLLDSLRQRTVVVADTGDFEAVRTYLPTDATTNPTLILKAAQSETGKPLLTQVLQDNPSASVPELLDLLLVSFGREILSIVPGRVSTEVDARLSFDTRATIERARHLIA